MGKQLKTTHFRKVEKETTLKPIQTGYAVAPTGEEATDIDGITPVNLFEGSLTNQTETQIGWICGRRQLGLEKEVTGQENAK